MQAEAATAAGRSMREEADRLLSEHRDRSLDLQKALKVQPLVATRQRGVPGIVSVQCSLAPNEIYLPQLGPWTELPTGCCPSVEFLRFFVFRPALHLDMPAGRNKDSR